MDVLVCVTFVFAFVDASFEISVYQAVTRPSSHELSSGLPRLGIKRTC